MISIADAFREEGAQRGRIEGRHEGKQEGRREGIEEEKLHVAEKLIQAGATTSFIIEITGLSVDIIEKLQEKYYQ